MACGVGEAVAVGDGGSAVAVGAGRLAVGDGTGVECGACGRATGKHDAVSRATRTVSATIETVRLLTKSLCFLAF